MVPGLSRIALDPLATRPLWLGGLAEIEATLTAVLGNDAADWQLGQQTTATLAAVLGNDTTAWQLALEVTATLAAVLSSDTASWVIGGDAIGTLEVSLVAPDGTPLAGVTVTVTPWQAFGTVAGVVPLLAQEVVTDADGVALIALPQSGTTYRYRLTADLAAGRVLDVELRVPESSG